MHSSTIVGYTFNADEFCTRCIARNLPTGDGQAFDGWGVAEFGGWDRMSSEDNLSEIAAAFGIDRDDEESFDSSEFPKVITVAHIKYTGEDTYCGDCGESLI